MSKVRHYETVAFDVRDNATMLIFANASGEGEINDYLLLMRTVDEDFDESIFIDINEQQFGGHDLIRESVLTGNVLTLRLREPAAALGGLTEIVLSFTETSENFDSIEAGAFRVFGDTLAGGTASMPVTVFSLYIVRCADNSLYTGIAADVGKRLTEHESGPRGAKYLRGRQPLKLEFAQEVGDRAVASRLEYRVKRLSRTQKEALIAGHESLDKLTGDQVSGRGST